MAIKKIQIPRISIDSTAPDGTYKLRYRILSENKNLYSEWSPYSIVTPSKSVVAITGTITPTYSYTSPNLTVNWTLTTGRIPYISKYDVYVEWYITSTNRTWVYCGQATSNDGLSYSFTTSKITGATKARAAVFAATYPKLSNDDINNCVSGKNGFMNKLFIMATYYNTP
jgi:hypothetical protein